MVEERQELTVERLPADTVNPGNVLRPGSPPGLFGEADT
jgi:hypothetical protein